MQDAAAGGTLELRRGSLALDRMREVHGQSHPYYPRALARDFPAPEPLEDHLHLMTAKRGYGQSPPGMRFNRNEMMRTAGNSSSSSSVQLAASGGADRRALGGRRFQCHGGVEWCP